LGLLSYDKKGPCHIWKKEIAAEKKEAAKQIAKLSKTLELVVKAQWELTAGLARPNLARNPPGRKPVWKFTKERGAITCE